MAEQKKMIRCDGCDSWHRMKEEDLGFGYVRFEHPQYWFRFYLGKVASDFCSWLCAKNYVDAMYSQRHPDDVKIGKR